MKKVEPYILKIDSITQQHYLSIPVWDIEKLTLSGTDLIIFLNKK